ncbi:uncharacterized protein LOC119086700 isoform X2 [Peromyscus leucopus]|uniref:uncharacterized protein LOC119086700 isoform X2 n=1 Tax=Peromyscus leucopus TaxID=10041 RepID=UPI001885512A|nr:uncharacterized protein LOC119086700 isoform X2 [Peromyscus leucopus]
MGTHACTHLLPNSQIPSPLSGTPLVSSSQIPEHRHKCVVNYAKLPLDTKAMPGTCIHTQAAPGLDLSAYFPDIYPARKRHAHYPTTIRHGAGHGALTCCPCNRGVAPSSPHTSRKPQSFAGVHCAAARLHANVPLQPAFLLAASPPHVRPARGRPSLARQESLNCGSLPRFFPISHTCQGLLLLRKNLPEIHRMPCTNPSSPSDKSWMRFCTLMSSKVTPSLGSILFC